MCKVHTHNCAQIFPYINASSKQSAGKVLTSMPPVSKVLEKCSHQCKSVASREHACALVCKLQSVVNISYTYAHSVRKYQKTSYVNFLVACCKHAYFKVYETLFKVMAYLCSKCTSDRQHHQQALNSYLFSLEHVYNVSSVSQ